MKKPKKAAAKKRIAAKQTAPAASAQPTEKVPLVAKEPRSKKEAAVQAGMFLYTDDNWSEAYFNDGDLHCMERKLFG